MNMTYQPIIGLEIHVELSTKSKMFCQCDASWQKYEPNANTCPVCLGLPGALPVPNKKAIEYTIKIAKALGCTINKHSHFDRKHYFYPDLAKGYQISQYDEPIGVNGILKFRVLSSTFQVEGAKQAGTCPMTDKSARINRVHLEEDTGKLIHVGSDTVVNFNRSSVPLVEIVTEPDFRSSDDVKTFLQELHTVITYLDVSDADMEKGSMRLEPNISVKQYQSTNLKQQNDNKNSQNELPRSRADGVSTLKENEELAIIGIGDLPKYKVEVKNINSFNFVKRAVDFEVKRQIALLEQGETPIQETRGWDDAKQQTYSQRSKEDAHDYRYFPEPDIPPMEFTEEYIEQIKKTIPELPNAKVNRYVKEFGLKESDAIVLTRDRNIAQYFEQIIANLQSKSCQSIPQNDNSLTVDRSIQTTHQTNLVTGGDKFPASKGIPPSPLWGVGMTSQIDNIFQMIANYIINKRLSTDLSVDDFVKRAVELAAPKITDSTQLVEAIDKVLIANNKSVSDYKSGKVNALMYLLGQVMKEMKGQAEAQIVTTELKKRLA